MGAMVQSCMEQPAPHRHTELAPAMPSQRARNERQQTARPAVEYHAPASSAAPGTTGFTEAALRDHDSRTAQPVRISEMDFNSMLQYIKKVMANTDREQAKALILAYGEDNVMYALPTAAGRLAADLIASSVDPVQAVKTAGMLFDQCVEETGLLNLFTNDELKALFIENSVRIIGTVGTQAVDKPLGHDELDALSSMGSRTASAYGARSHTQPPQTGNLLN